MRFIVLSRQARQVAPPATDKVAFWEQCRDYIAELHEQGKLEAYFWMNVLPAGLGSPKAMKGAGLINVDSAAEAQRLLSNYPGYDAEGGLSFELIPVLDSERPYQHANRRAFKFLALGKPTLYKAPPAQNKEAFQVDCQAYLQELMENEKIEYAGWALGPDQVKAYFFMNVESHEELFATLQRYPGTTLEEGYQWEFHTLLDNAHCLNSMLEEAREKAGS